MQDKINMSENYLRDINDADGILDCYIKYGAVGITNVLSAAEANDTVHDLINILHEQGCSDKLTFDDAYTYEYASKAMNRYGVIGKNALFSPTLQHNRYHPNVKKAYSIVYQRPINELLCQYDRAAWMRPVIGPEGESWSHFDTPFTSPGLHLDLYPGVYFEEEYHQSTLDWINDIKYGGVSDFTKENNCKNIKMGRQVQGILNLLDNYESNGGFHFVPGGYELTENWYTTQKKRFPVKELNDRYFFTPKDYEFCYPQRLPCPAGTLILFDAALPHGTKPNTTNMSRMIQFLRYCPRDIYQPKTLAKRRKLIINMCKKFGCESPDEDVI